MELVGSGDTPATGLESTDDDDDEEVEDESLL